MFPIPADQPEHHDHAPSPAASGTIPLHQNTPPTEEVHSTGETQVVDRADQEIVEPQYPTQVLEPNTVSNSQILTNEPNDNLRILADATDELEEEIMSAPIEQPPPLKRRRIHSEDSFSPSVSSQQDMDLEMATEQLLESFSQQDDAIEFRHRAMASCT